MPKKSKKPFKYNAKSVPTGPGCYLFWDEKGALLYVGKAKHLRKRVGNYFQKTPKGPRLDLLVKKIVKIETRVVNSEMEALILENNLIKEFMPRFNVLLRDDKNFLYLRLTPDPVPKIEITRRIVRDGSFYFGPKTAAKQFRKTIDFCQKIFKIRTCKLTMEVENAEIKVLKNPENRKLPCLDYHLGKCSAPCANTVTTTQYSQSIELMKQFLRGHTGEVMKDLQNKMMQFAEEKNFEAAACARDLMQSIGQSTERQTVQQMDGTDRDFIHFHTEGTTAYFVRIAFRNGKLLDQNEIEFRTATFTTDAELLEQFLLQFYEKVDEPPCEICIPEKLENPEEVATYISNNFFDQQKIKILTPQRGDKRAVLQMAQKNAQHFAKKKQLEQLSHAENFATALPELAEALGFDQPPRRIECFDISHLGGGFPVASQSVFVNGEAKPAEYRRFQVKTLPDGKIDDFASMKEILTRRFARSGDKKYAKEFPDLIVLDGGKGQLSTVMKIFEEMKPPKDFDPQTQIIALAKREEQIFRPKNPDPLELPFQSPALKLLQRIRDEAHRFAVSYNRSLRGKAATKSALDEIPGIGPTTKKKLLQEFETASGVRKAKDSELLKILSQKQLDTLKKFL